MAAPATATIRNLQGKWVMNKSQSDSTEAVLALQGVGWALRKTLGFATVTQELRQTEVTEDGQTVTSIEIIQTATGGIKGSTETRTTDWKFRGHSDWLFGNVDGRSRYNTINAVLEENKGKGVAEGDAKYITEGWLPETINGEVVESFVENKENKWAAWQLWGFEEINGERKLTRKFAVRKTDKDEVVKIQLVYDWVEPIA